MPPRSGKSFSIGEIFALMDSTFKINLTRSLLGWVRWINKYKSIQIRLTLITGNQPYDLICQKQTEGKPQTLQRRTIPRIQIGHPCVGKLNTTTLIQNPTQVFPLIEHIELDKTVGHGRPICQECKSRCSILRQMTRPSSFYKLDISYALLLSLARYVKSLRGSDLRL